MMTPCYEPQPDRTCSYRDEPSPSGRASRSRLPSTAVSGPGPSACTPTARERLLTITTRTRPSPSQRSRSSASPPAIMWATSSAMGPTSTRSARGNSCRLLTRTHVAVPRSRWTDHRWSSALVEPSTVPPCRSIRKVRIGRCHSTCSIRRMSLCPAMPPLSPPRSSQTSASRHSRWVVSSTGPGSSVFK